MLKPLADCIACLGSGKRLPECEPWNKLPGGDCRVCSGLGRQNAVRLSSLCVGDLFSCQSGVEYVISRKNKDGVVVVAQSGERTNVEDYWPHNPPVRVIRRADVAFNIPGAK